MIYKNIGSPCCVRLNIILSQEYFNLKKKSGEKHKDMVQDFIERNEAMYI